MIDSTVWGFSITYKDSCLWLHSLVYHNWLGLNLFTLSCITLFSHQYLTYFSSYVSLLHGYNTLPPSSVYTFRSCWVHLNKTYRVYAMDTYWGYFIFTDDLGYFIGNLFFWIGFTCQLPLSFLGSFLWEGKSIYPFVHTVITIVLGDNFPAPFIHVVMFMFIHNTFCVPLICNRFTTTDWWESWNWPVFAGVYHTDDRSVWVSAFLYSFIGLN